MASITASNLTLDIPIYQHLTSWRQDLIVRPIGGLIRRRAETRRTIVRALDNVSFQLNAGDRVGVIGPNGAGKTTLLKILSGVYTPTGGRLERKGEVVSLLSTNMGANDDLTGYENLYSIGLHFGMSRKYIESRMEEMAAFSELGDFLNLPVRTYSAGMKVRIGFAVATSIEPEILIMDEMIGAGDHAFAAKARKRAEQMISKATIYMVASHSNSLLRALCNKGIFMRNGTLEYFGEINETLARYDAFEKTAATL
ncbi:MAG: ABC transporter ATP-binding protein [Pseudomonadota bacterium]|nr:ABC transporter ATP-binding protein [Pseudomonadota bacterium]